MRRVLRVPGLGLLLAGQTLSMFGDRALLLVLAIWAKTLTGSSAAAAMVIFVMVAPALFAPIGGLVVGQRIEGLLPRLSAVQVAWTVSCAQAEQ